MTFDYKQCKFFIQREYNYWQRDFYRMCACIVYKTEKMRKKDGKIGITRSWYIYLSHTVFRSFFFFFFNFIFFHRSFFSCITDCAISNLSVKFMQLQRIVPCTSYSLRAYILFVKYVKVRYNVQYFCTHGLVCLFVNFCAIIRFVAEQWKILL